MEHFLDMPAVIGGHVMHELMPMVQRVAMTPAPVLITGEAGCGKKLVARAARLPAPQRQLLDRVLYGRVCSLDGRERRMICWSEGGSRV